MNCLFCWLHWLASGGPTQGSAVCAGPKALLESCRRSRHGVRAVMARTQQPVACQPEPRRPARRLYHRATVKFKAAIRLAPSCKAWGGTAPEDMRSLGALLTTKAEGAGRPRRGIGQDRTGLVARRRHGGRRSCVQRLSQSHGCRHAEELSPRRRAVCRLHVRTVESLQGRPAGPRQGGSRRQWPCHERRREGHDRRADESRRGIRGRIAPDVGAAERQTARPAIGTLGRAGPRRLPSPQGVRACVRNVHAMTALSPRLTCSGQGCGGIASARTVAVTALRSTGNATGSGCWSSAGPLLPSANCPRWTGRTHVKNGGVLQPPTRPAGAGWLRRGGGRDRLWRALARTGPRDVSRMRCRHGSARSAAGALRRPQADLQSRFRGTSGATRSTATASACGARKARRRANRACRCRLAALPMTASAHIVVDGLEPMTRTSRTATIGESFSNSSSRSFAAK